MNNTHINNNCLACGSKKLTKSLQLGKQPLANSFKESLGSDEYKYDLGLNLCTDCFHLQLTTTVDPKIIYKNYLYVSGTSKTLKDYSNWFAGLVDEVIDRQSYNILDIGCNDGTQLDSFKSLGYNTYGIDPAENIHLLSSKNHKVVCDYFNKNSAESFNVIFDSIIAQNVFAHNPNPLQFLETCKNIMSDHTLLLIQTSQADMVLNNEFDTIYHEHINFFNINSMNELCKRAGLNLVDVFKTPIHGTSYVFAISKTIAHPYYIQNLITMENKLLQLETYKSWENNIIINMKNLKNTIQFYKNERYELIGYGAAAKGNTLLNFADIKLDVIIDDNPLKQNLFTPGTDIPVMGSEMLDTLKYNDKVMFIPLAWNFFNEIKDNIMKKRKNKNDVFIRYFPKVEVIHV